MGKRILISEEERDDIKLQHNLDIDPDLLNYLRRNVKFKKHNTEFSDWKVPLISYIVDGRLKSFNSNKETLNRIYVSLDDKWTKDEAVARRTIRKYINGMIDSLK